MPWTPSYTEADARAAIAAGTSWRAVLRALGLRYHGNSIARLRRWAEHWRIDTDHLPAHRAPRRHYGEMELRIAIATSRSWAEALRRLGYCPSGGNWKTLKKRAAALGLSSDHFDPYAASRQRNRRSRTPLDEILVPGSTFSRSCLKQRLYEEGLKQPTCELCGQGENWRGERMGMILDHANGVRDDHRLENLRILCPNCAATLDTHCGRKNRAAPSARDCLRCKRSFVPKYRGQRYCSAACGRRWNRRGVGRPAARQVERPPHDLLLPEVEEFGFVAAARKYGVSDNAIRKWLRQYEQEQLFAVDRAPSPTEA